MLKRMFLVRDWVVRPAQSCGLKFNPLCKAIEKKLISVEKEDTQFCASFCFRSRGPLVTEVLTINHLKTTTIGKFYHRNLDIKATVRNIPGYVMLRHKGNLAVVFGFSSKLFILRIQFNVFKY